MIIIIIIIIIIDGKKYSLFHERKGKERWPGQFVGKCCDLPGPFYFGGNEERGRERGRG